jgi:hypothetical protein
MYQLEFIYIYTCEFGPKLPGKFLLKNMIKLMRSRGKIQQKNREI